MVIALKALRGINSLAVSVQSCQREAHWHCLSSGKNSNMAIKRIAVEFGMGTDLRGEDYTKAACRALRDALWHNALTAYRALGYNPEEMLVEITIGVTQPDQIDQAELIKLLPYGQATVTLDSGGLDIDHEQGVGKTIVANAAVIVSLNFDEKERNTDAA